MSAQYQEQVSIDAKLIARAMKDEAFRTELLNNPEAAKAAVEQELGQKLPETAQIRVVQESDDVAYIILPATASETEQLSETELEAVAAGAFTIKVACSFFSICFTTNKCF
jgi:phosphopentomutase